jgi:hypothetical protein
MVLMTLMSYSRSYGVVDTDEIDSVVSFALKSEICGVVETAVCYHGMSVMTVI